MTGSGRVAPDAPSKTFPTLANRAEGRGQPAGQPDSYGGTGSGLGGTGVVTTIDETVWPNMRNLSRVASSSGMVAALTLRGSSPRR